MHSLFTAAAALALLGLGPAPAPAQQNPACRPTVQGRLDIVDFESKTFPGARKLRIWLPPGYDAAKPYPVLYMFDGQNLFDRCTGYGNQEWTADEVASRLIAEGKIPPLIIVGIDNAGARRAQEYLPYPDPFNPDAAQVEGEKLIAFLREVIDFTGARYKLGEARGLGGSSYGGIATLQTVLHRPDLFNRALIESPSLQVGNGQLLRDAATPYALPERVFVGMGSAELAIEADAPSERRAFAQRVNAGSVSAVKRLAGALEASAMPAAIKLVVAPGAHHNEAAWATRLPEALTFLFGPDPQARR